MTEMKKEFSLEVEIRWNKESEEHIWKDKAELSCNAETQFSSVVRFIQRVKKIVSKVKNTYGKFGDTATYSLSFTEYVYSNENGGKMVKYDRWESDRVGDVNEEGIYFLPNEKYTDAQRDMFISFTNPLEDIIFTLH